MSTGRSHSVFRLMAACLLAIISVCCSQRGDGSDGVTKGAQPLRQIKVGYIRIAESAHLYIGLSRSYFQDEGLDVRLQPMAGGNVILPAVEKGDLDIGFSNVISMILRNSTRPVDDPGALKSLVGGTFERPGFSNHALLVRKGEFHTPTALASGPVRVAINTTRNIEQLALRRYLKAKGINESSIQVKEIPFPQMLRALEIKDVDVAAVVEPFIEPALRTQRFDLLDRHYLVVAHETPVATYVITRRWEREHPDLAAAFVRAFQKSSEFLKRQPQEARAIIGQYTGIPKEDLAIMGLPAFEVSMPDASIQALRGLCLEYGFLPLPQVR